MAILAQVRLCSYSSPSLSLSLSLVSLSPFLFFLFRLAFTMAPGMSKLAAAQKEESRLLLRKAWLEQELKKARLGLKECAVTIVREKKTEKVAAQAVAVDKKSSQGSNVRGLVCKHLIKKPVGLHKDPVHKWMVGTNKAGVRYGPGYLCWQCERQLSGKLGGHRHSCDKVKWAR